MVEDLPSSLVKECIECCMLYCKLKFNYVELGWSESSTGLWPHEVNMVLASLWEWGPESSVS